MGKLISAAIAAVALAGGPALAQQPAAPAMGQQPEAAAQQPGGPIDLTTDGPTLIGKFVTTSNGAQVGRIQGIVPGEGGDPGHILVGGGTSGLIEIPVDLAALGPDDDVVLTLTEDDFNMIAEQARTEPAAGGAATPPAAGAPAAPAN